MNAAEWEEQLQKVVDLQQRWAYTQKDSDLELWMGGVNKYLYLLTELSMPGVRPPVYKENKD